MSTKKNAKSTQAASPALVKILGPSLLRKADGTKISTKDALVGKELVILYFSASWCPPCKAFSPILSKFYKAIHKQAKLEIIYVSSDRTLESFKAYYGTMPFLAIDGDDPEVKKNLAELFQVSGIPTTVVLNGQTGEYLTDDAREAITAAAAAQDDVDNNKAMQVISDWKSKDPVPLEEAGKNRGGAAGGDTRNPIVRLLFTILKNPMYIFGLLYMYKYVRKEYFSSPITAAGMPPPVSPPTVVPSTSAEFDDVPAVDDTPADSEF